MTRKCGAKTRAGGKCGRPAGWGTGHVGVGRCKMHGGASPSGEKHGAKLKAVALSAGMLGAEVPTSPLDAMQISVDLARGIVLYHHAELAKAYALIGTEQEAEGRRRIEAHEAAYGAAVKQLGDMGKGAVIAGVAERRQRLVELDGARLAELFLGAIQDVDRDWLTPARQSALARAMEARFSVLEGEPERPALPAPS